jgi:hypothetical protein
MTQTNGTHQDVKWYTYAPPDRGPNQKYAAVTLPPTGIYDGGLVVLHFDASPGADPELSYLISFCDAFAREYQEIKWTEGDDRQRPSFTDDQLHRLLAAASGLAAAFERVVGNAPTKLWDGLTPDPTPPNK